MKYKLIIDENQEEIEYLRSRDAGLGAVIDHVGFIDRAVDPDIFASLVKNIVGQQISNAALKTVLSRVEHLIGEYTPENVCRVGVEALRSCGMSMKKAENIHKAAKLCRKALCRSVRKLIRIGICNSRLGGIADDVFKIGVLRAVHKHIKIAVRVNAT